MTRDELQTVLEVLDQCELSDPDFVSKWKHAHDIVKAALEAPKLEQNELTPEQVHELCHDLPSTVSLPEFARGCIEYQRKLYGASMPGTMNSEPHILDLEFALDEISKEMLDIERRRREDPANEHARGEHRAYFSMKIQFMALLANWRDNVPMSREAEILINGETPDEESTT